VLANMSDQVRDCIEALKNDKAYRYIMLTVTVCKNILLHSTSRPRKV
jgi:hypothetical protein